MGLSPAAASPRKWLWRLLTLLLGILIMSLIIREIDWPVFLERLSRLSPLTILAVAAAYLLLNLFRCLRYRTLLDRPDLSLRLFFPISQYHNFVVRILPFKLGEVWYVILMQRYFGLSVEAGVGSLFASRLLELLVIVLVGSAALLVSGTVMAGQGALQVLFLMMIFGAGLPGFYFGGLILRGLARLLRRLSWPPLHTLAARIEGLAREFDQIRQPRIFLSGLFWSVFTYLCSFASNALLLAATGVELPLATLILAVTLGMFASAIPFNVAGFGMVELSWLFVLTRLLGMDAGEAAGVGLLLNGSQIVTAVLYGVIAYAVLRAMQRPEQNSVET